MAPVVGVQTRTLCAKWEQCAESRRRSESQHKPCVDKGFRPRFEEEGSDLQKTGH